MIGVYYLIIIEFNFLIKINNVKKNLLKGNKWTKVSKRLWRQ